jgi:AraC-like DNA-binding protein
MYISPVNLKIVAYALDIEGFDSRSVLQRCGIDSGDDLKEDGEWLSLDVFDRMMAAAIEVTGDPAFGLVVGRSLALTKYGVITPLVMSTPTLRQALEDLGRYARLALDRSEIELHESGQEAHLRVQPVVHGGLSGRFRLEQVATSAVQMLRFAGASHAHIHHVDFPHRISREHEARYTSTFGPRINFERKACVVRFDPALLDARLPGHDPVAYVAARARADAALAAMHAGSNVAEQVRQWLLGAFPRLPTVAETAQHLGMNERGLRRQLAMMETTHADLIQECQRLMAERWLAEGKRPLKQIAESLGFSSVHSFHRAFRRWVGLTPSDWREGLGGNPHRAPTDE